MYPAIDSIILYELVCCLRERRSATIRTYSQRDRSREFEDKVLPLQIRISAADGRQYLLAYNYGIKAVLPYRIDTITDVSTGDVDDDFYQYRSEMDQAYDKAWNISIGPEESLKELRIVFNFPTDAEYLSRRLYREKRTGDIKSLGDGRYEFTIQTYDMRSVKPFIRSFIGSIESVECSDDALISELKDEIEALRGMYR